MLHHQHFLKDPSQPRVHICDRCHRPLVLIDYRERLLKGCLRCNLWGRPAGRPWTHLPSHDLRTLESMMGEAMRGQSA
jgi:hypothetical protein